MSCSFPKCSVSCHQTGYHPPHKCTQCMEYLHMHTMRWRVPAHAHKCDGESAYAHNAMESVCTCTQCDGECLHTHTKRWRVPAPAHNAMESVCTCTQCNGEYRYMYTPQWRVQAHAYAREHSYTLWSVCVALCPGIVLNTVTNKKLLCQTPNSLSPVSYTHLTLPTKLPV